MSLDLPLPWFQRFSYLIVFPRRIHVNNFKLIELFHGPQFSIKNEKIFPAKCRSEKVQNEVKREVRQSILLSGNSTRPRRDKGPYVERGLPNLFYLCLHIWCEGPCDFDAIVILIVFAFSCTQIFF